MFKKIIRMMKLLLFAIPIFFIYLGHLYKDNLYYLLSLVTFFFSFLITFPRMFSKNIIELKKPNFRNLIKKNKKGKQIRYDFILTSYFKLLIIITILYAVIFTYLNIFKLNNISTKANLFINYFISFTKLSLDYINYFLFLFIATTLFIFFTKKSEYKIKLNLILKKILASICLNLSTLISGLILSVILTFLIAFIQLNFISINSRLNKQFSGIITDSQSIVKKLQQMDRAPIIIPYNSKEKNKLLMALINSNQNNFYINSVIPSIPSILIIPFQTPSKSLFLVNNILVVKNINPSDIEPISPYIGYLIVKDYFKGRYIKSYPSVKVMGRQEYLNYRIQQYENVISKFNDYLQSLKNQLSNYYGQIQTDKDNIAGWQNGIQTANSYKSYSYNNCMSASYYDFYTGSYIHYNNESYCQNLSSQWDGYISKANQSIDSLNQDINLLQGYISQVQNNINITNSYIVSLEAAKMETPQELGVFEPKNSIKIAVDETSSNIVTDYFETLTHEYLHYSSYVNEDQSLSDSFFEEGLTEYFARKAIKNEFGINTHQGYPLVVAIISEMAKKIPESELADIYFKKDESSLEAILVNNYGEKFYSDFKTYFGIISYMSPSQALDMANAIMLRIGGRTLKELDIYSSPDTTN